MWNTIVHKLLRTFLGYFSRRQFYEPGGYREIWTVAWPLIILNASNTIMMISNRAFLAWNSPEEIAASMPAGQMFFTLMAFFLITTGFTATIVAQYHGANDRIGCVRAAWNGFYFGTAVAALLVVLLPLGGAWIILHNGHDPTIARYELEYFIGMLPCAGLACMETALLSFFTGRGHTTLVATIKIIGCCLCIPLNYILIFGKFGLPPLGILGAGMANALASLATMLISMGFFLFQDQNQYATRRYRQFEWSCVRKLIFFGTPAGLQTFIRNAAFAIVIMMVGHLGNEALAAASIALSINMIGNMPMIGLLDATSIITGQYIGRGRLMVAQRIAGRSLRMLWSWMLLAAVFYLFFPDMLIRIFGSRARGEVGMDMALVETQVRTILQLAVVFNLFDALRFITMGSLRGAGDTRVPLVIGMATSWLIQIPGTVLLIYVFEATIGQVWGLITFYIIVDAALMVWRRRTGAWKKIRVIEHPAPPVEEPVESPEMP